MKNLKGFSLLSFSLIFYFLEIRLYLEIFWTQISIFDT